jgi:outer membrane protein
MTNVFSIRKSLSIFLLIAVTGLASGQKFKVATIDFQYLASQYHVVQQALEEKAYEQEALEDEKFEREKRIKNLQAELERMVKEMQDPTLSASRRQTVREAAQSKEADVQALVRERTVFIEDSLKNLQKKYRAQSEQINDTIAQTVREFAATKDVDFVFDGTGLSNQNVPFLIYVRDPVDFTDAVLEILNKDAPKKTEKEESTGKTEEK